MSLISFKSSFNPQRQAALLKKRTAEIINEEMINAVVSLEKNSPVGATQELKKSWDLFFKESNGEFIVRIVNTSSFSLNRLEGRKAGTPPPSKALESWVALKLRVPQKEVKRVAFLVARKIGREGTNRSKRNFREFNPVDGRPVKNGSIDRALKKIQLRLNNERITN